MILVLSQSKLAYRLRSYEDFIRRFPLHHQQVLFYGPWFETWKDPPPHVISRFHKGWSMSQVFDEYLGGNEPDALFLMSSSALSQFGYTDFTKFSCKQFLFYTDAVSHERTCPANFGGGCRCADDERLAAMRQHKMKPFTAVFHNYLYRLDQLQSYVPAEQYIHWPCWSAHCFDAETQGTTVAKDLEFLISGVPGGDEYRHRDLFAMGVRGAGLSVQSQLGPRTNEEGDNERFRRDLLRSKFSPHDGGIHGRMVPRYFESCFAKSVIISPDLGEEMRRAGFEHGRNSLIFDRRGTGPRESLRILQDAKERSDWAELSQAAYELAKARHCTDARIRQFLEAVL